MRSSLAAGLLFLGLALAGPVQAASLTAYANPRFNFSVDVPRGLVRLPPPDNGDGQTWRSRDGQVRLLAWGSYGPGVLDIPRLADYAAYMVKAQQDDGGRVTYKRLLGEREGNGSFVLSGFLKDGRIFYEKTLVRAGQAATVRVEYPVSARPVWDSLGAEVARTLRWGQR